MSVYLLCFSLSFTASLILTPLCILIAKRLGHIAFPSPRGWHQKPTPLLGGMALLVSFFIGFVFTVPNLNEFRWVILGSLFCFLLGLIDDVYHLKPYTKLICQIAIAGFILHENSWILLGFIVLIMNSFNLLDNMDGIAAGVSSLTALGVAFMGMAYHQNGVALAGLALAGACGGFLVYNFHPAKIFMGDSGSLLLGFALSSLLVIPPHLPTSSLGHFFILLLFLAIPLSDTFFVIYSRFKKGKPIIHGGQDHLSHWILSRGFSPTMTVLSLYGLTLLSLVLAIVLCLYR